MGKVIRTKVKDLLAMSPGQTVLAKGWVRTKRGNKNVAFIALNDGSSIKNIQIVADVAKFDENLLKKITTGACIAVTGDLVESLGGGQSVEIQAREIEIYGEADPDTYPLQKKGHTLEFLRTIAHLRPRAGEMFQVTTFDLNNPPRLENGQIDYTQDFFGRQTSLTVSGQLEGELGAMALGEIYTFGPTFRAENSNTPRHLAEFWMIEPEMAFYEIEDNMDLAEDFIKYLVRYALDNCMDDLKFLNDMFDKELIARLEGVVKTEFVRLTYTEGMKILENSGEKFEFPVGWGVDLQSEHERYLVEKHFGRPVIMTDYPKDIKAFYMKQNEDGKTVRGMDVLFPKIGEIIGGSERESSLEKLEARINELGMSHDTLEWYLDTRRFGSAPHSGFGLGFERLLLFVTGLANIRDVIPFPRTPKNAEF